jgi:hypothetical protein
MFYSKYPHMWDAYDLPCEHRSRLKSACFKHKGILLTFIEYYKNIRVSDFKM